MALSFEEAIRALAESQPDMPLRRAILEVSRNPNQLATDTVQGRAEFALENAAIRALMPDKKINAIKELRSHLGIGLKEAKEAVELAQVLLDRGYMTADERAALAIEEEAAVASILGTG